MRSGRAGRGAKTSRPWLSVHCPVQRLCEWTRPIDFFDEKAPRASAGGAEVCRTRSWGNSRALKLRGGFVKVSADSKSAPAGRRSLWRAQVGDAVAPNK